MTHSVLPFGVAPIDSALPGGGLALGAVHEFLGAAGDEEDGAATAGFIAGVTARLPSSAAMRARGKGTVLWCLKQPDLYGPGLAAHGLDPARLVLVIARRDDEVLWVIEEALRPGSGLAAVVGEIGRLPMVAGRRLQLAAEHSGTIAFLLRRWRNAAEAAAERERPSAALTRWRITALPSHSHPATRKGMGQARWRLELLRCRGGVPGSWEVEVADAAGLVSISAGLADRPVAPAWHAAQQFDAARLAG